MTEYISKTFTLGKSTVITLPKGLGIRSGTKVKISPEKNILRLKLLRPNPKSTYAQQLLTLKGDWFDLSQWKKIRHQIASRLQQR
ncbi:MAG: hypothetical protein HYS86_03340 [Candidatus Chisholmbacteria bacterium]|nr:hypothetical protein [Candidatus Chisholmbacteria bacterium]